MKLNGPNPERGELLFQDEWAAKRRFKDVGTIVATPIMMLLGLVVIGIGFLEKTIVIIVPGVFVTLFAYFFLSDAVKLMPFRVYERGFTLPKAPSFTDGLYRRETFIRWERLERIEPLLKLNYDGGQEANPDWLNLDDPFGAIKALHRQVPEKMTDAFQPYLAPIETREVRRDSFSDSGWGIGSLLPGILFLFMVFLWGSAVGKNVMDEKAFSPSSIIFYIVMAGTAVSIGWLTFSVDTRCQRNLVRAEASPTPEGVSLPVTILGRLARQVRPLLLWSEIRKVRLRLCPLRSIHQAEIVTVRGERFLVPYEVLEAASRLSTFKSVDYDFENRAPSPSRGPAWRWNPVGLGVLGVIALVVFLFGFLAGYSG